MTPIRQLMLGSTMLLGTTLVVASHAGQKEQVAPKAVQTKLLYATLWVRTSGEYSAVCRQTYNWALRRVQECASLTDNPGARPMAVIMDLDETVFDNSAFQAHLITAGKSGDVEEFFTWAGKNPGKVAAIPGAKGFIREVQKLGVHIAFVSNRSEEIRDATEESLMNIGVSPPYGLHLRRGKDFDKRPRFNMVTKEYQVIAFVGDNLGDFPEPFDPPQGGGPGVRRERVSDKAEFFGRSWFVLPNPMYGDWTKYVENDLERHLADDGR